MEPGRERNTHTGTSVPVPLGDGGDQPARNPADGVLEPRLLQARAHAGGSARASAQVHPDCRASSGTPGHGASECVDARLHRYRGRTFFRVLI